MASIQHSRFTTRTLPEADRLGAWKEDISLIFDFDKVHQTNPTPFHATFDVFHFGNSAFAHLDSVMGRYQRSRRKAAQDGMDSIMLQLFLKGGVQFQVGQRTTYARAGDIVVFDLAQTVDNINSDFRHLTFVWPRIAIEGIVPNIAAWHGYSLPRDNPSTILLRKHMVGSYDMASRLNPRQAKGIEDASLALIGAAMADSNILPSEKQTPALKEVLVYQIKRYIRQNLDSPQQTPNHIARHFGISRRHLYQLLKPLGGIARYQTHLRLQRCFADLRNPLYAHLQISEIAYRWGFHNMVTFNRNFRQTFGIKPSEAREIIDADPTSHIPTPSDTLTEHQQWFRALGS